MVFWGARKLVCLTFLKKNSPLNRSCFKDSGYQPSIGDKSSTVEPSIFYVGYQNSSTFDTKKHVLYFVCIHFVKISILDTWKFFATFLEWLSDLVEFFLQPWPPTRESFVGLHWITWQWFWFLYLFMGFLKPGGGVPTGRYFKIFAMGVFYDYPRGFSNKPQRVEPQHLSLP